VTAIVAISDLDERTLLRELTHRINNELVFSINAVSAAAVRADNPEVKVALSNVVDLLQHQADVHRILRIPDGDDLVDAAEYIRKLGSAVSRGMLERLGIRLALAADTLPLQLERCWRLALAAHELLRNVARHACFDGRDGSIKVKLTLADTVVNCIIADNGSLPTRLRPGRGLQIVSNLARSLGGRLEYGSGAQFTSFLLVFPLTEREQKANRVAAQRRAKSARRCKTVAPLSRPQLEAAKPALDAMLGVPKHLRAAPRTAHD